MIDTAKCLSKVLADRIVNDTIVHLRVCAVLRFELEMMRQPFPFLYAVAAAFRRE